MFRFKINNFKRLNSIFKGALLALKTHTLPQHIIDFLKNPLVRILRVLGGLSVMLILSNKLLDYSIVYTYVAMLFSVIFLGLHLYINFYRVKNIITILKSDKFDVRNSPINVLLRASSRIILCIKGTCEGAVPITTAMTVGFGIDQILDASGREKVFTPFFAEYLNRVAGNPDSTTRKINDLTNRSKVLVEDENAYNESIESISD